jgi:cation transport ATPase
MTHTYNITGMTCSSCVAKAKSQLLLLPDVTEADVQLTAPQARISMQKHIPVSALQTAISKAGNYTIKEADGGMHDIADMDEQSSWFETYKPILIIGAYIIGITFLVEAASGVFDLQNWMSNFMGAFFIVFSFFKMLDLKGFAESYSSYNIVAKKWMSWGYVYAFIELLLGIAFLTRIDPLITNATTLVVMAVSIVGVLQTVLSKRKIKCACLGSVFNLPMSTITVIEDGLMIIMSTVSLLHLIP